jgi:imidazolonepropionase-like amidohydrolase
MKKAFAVVALVCLFAISTASQSQTLAPAVHQFVKVDADVIALTHVRVIDGTGAAAREDQTIILRHGKIESLGDSAKLAPPAGAQVLDLTGYSVIPGLVGMHDHLFYTASNSRDAAGRTPPPGAIFTVIPFSAPRLYLATGVTTMRTTGSLEPYSDLAVKKQIDSGRMAGPKLDVTGPYLEGPGANGPQLHELSGPDDARRIVNYWADEGVTSFKAYMHITRAEFGAAIEEAHKRGIKVTGHLCSVSYREAIALGIDDFEHGPVYTDSEFFPGKQPDACPMNTSSSWVSLDVAGPQVQELIRDLVAHHVAVTSTLPVFELSLAGRPALQQRVLDAMCAESRQNYLANRARSHAAPAAQLAQREDLFKKELQFERAFVQAGGLLLAGPDPTGTGGTLPGFGDQREVELLVEAGFTPLEAIRIATYNGAQYLGQLDKIGTIAAGKQADLVVIKGNPAQKIDDIENVEIVFKEGVGYDSAKLIESVRGQVGIR